MFQGDYYNLWISEWDIHPDGKRFLMIKPSAQTDNESTVATIKKLNIVVNWLEELKQKVPVD